MRRVHAPCSTTPGAAGCAEALEPAFMQLVERAELAGWPRDRILAAVCVLTWRLIEPDLVLTDRIAVQ